MRTLLALILVPLAFAAGCFGNGPAGPLVECDGIDHPVRLYFGPDWSLQETLPRRGSVPGNSFAGAFATDNLDEWLSPTILEPLHLSGDVKLTLWVEFRGSPAPIVDPATGEGYQFFNQFGSDRTFQPGYVTEYDAPVQSPGTQTRYAETIALPAGGFELEAGDRVRLLLTSLALDSDSGSGHDILYGNPMASRLDFTARCTDVMSWTVLDDRIHEVSLPGNQGLFTGQAPPSEYNTVTLPLHLMPETERLTIDLRQGSDPNPAKDDVDIELVNGAGTAYWSIGSPYSNEHGVLWSENLDFLRVNNVTGVRVNSYSGLLYEGTLAITQEIGEPA